MSDLQRLLACKKFVDEFTALVESFDSYDDLVIDFVEAWANKLELLDDPYELHNDVVDVLVGGVDINSLDQVDAPWSSGSTPRVGSNEPVPLHTLEISVMSNKFTVVHLIDGQEVDKMSTSAVFAALSDREARIEALNKLKNKPKSITAEIASIQADIDALVAYLDSKEPAAA